MWKDDLGRLLIINLWCIDHMVEKAKGIESRNSSYGVGFVWRWIDVKHWQLERWIVYDSTYWNYVKHKFACFFWDWKGKKTCDEITLAKRHIVLLELVVP